MKCLFLHCKTFSYTLHHPTPVAEDAASQSASFDNPMVVFVAVERDDTPNIVATAARDARKLSRRAGANHIIINPFAHLSSSLAAPDVAKAMARSLHEKLVETWDGQTSYTSFGWYKEFLLDVQGHEDSQVFREYR